MSQKVAIGIDLGSSKCCVGVVLDGQVEIIENDRGVKTTPNYVAFTDVETLTGSDAKDQAASNPSSTVYGVKRLIGRNIHCESRLKRELKVLPFDVRYKSNGRLGVKVKYKQTAITVSLEQITALMLVKLKEMAESRLGCPVNNAVISVPTQFNDNQRRATVNACRMAGLNTLALINEPTAAALAYIHGKTFVRIENLLIFDVGAASVSVSVVRVGTENVEVRAIGGDLMLGGSDFDVKMMDHCVNSFYEKNGDQVKLDSKAYSKLKLACEEAKHTLALLPKTNVHVESLIGELDFDCPISRKSFEEMCLLNCLERAEKLIKEVLNDAKLGKSEIDEVVLIGGSTRIPCIQKMLQEFFDGKELNKTVNANEGVAFGAAIQAAILGGNHTISDVRISDIVHNPLYWKKNTKSSDSNGIPKYIKISQYNKEKEFLVEDSAVAFNSFKNVRTSHAIDLVGLHVTSHVAFVTNNLKISFCGKALSQMEGLLSEEDISVMSSEVKQFIIDNKEQTQCVVAAIKLESFCFKVKDVLAALSVNSDKAGTLKQPCEDPLQNEKNMLENCCNEVLDWLDKSDLCGLQDFLQKRDQLFSLCKRSGLSYLCQNENTKSATNAQNSETQKETIRKKKKNKKCKSKKNACNKQLNSLNKKYTNSSNIEEVKKYTKFSNSFVHKWKKTINGLSFDQKEEPNICENKQGHDSLDPGNAYCNDDSSGASVEQQGSSGESVEQQDSSGVSVEQQDSLGASVEQQDSSGASVEQQDFSEVSVEQKDSSGASMEQQGSSGASVEQQGSSGASVEQQDSSGASVEQLASSGASMEQQGSSGASVEQQGSSGASVEQLASSGASVEQLASSGASMEPLHTTVIDAECLEMSASAANKVPSSTNHDGMMMSSTLSSGSILSQMSAGELLSSMITSTNVGNDILDSTGSNKEFSAPPEIIPKDLKHLMLTDVVTDAGVCSSLQVNGSLSGFSHKIRSAVIDNHDRQSHHHLQSQPSLYEPRQSGHYLQRRDYSQSQPSQNHFYENARYPQIHYNHQSQDQVQYNLHHQHLDQHHQHLDQHHQHLDQHHQLQGNHFFQRQNRSFKAQFYDQSQYFQHQSNNYRQPQNPHCQNQILPRNEHRWYPPIRHPHQIPDQQRVQSHSASAKRW